MYICLSIYKKKNCINKIILYNIFNINQTILNELIYIIKLYILFFFTQITELKIYI